MKLQIIGIRKGLMIVFPRASAKTQSEVCVCVLLYLLHIEDRNTHSTSQIRTYRGRQHIWTGPHTF